MSIPYMPLYVADYVGDTQHLSTEQHGAYLLLLMALWRAGGRLPNDPVKIARIVRLSPSKWGRIADDVMAFFTVDDDGITQKRLAVEIEKASKKYQVRSEAGKAGAEAKALKNNKPATANASRLLQHSSEPEPDVREEEKTDPKGSCPKPARGRISYPPAFEELWKGFPTDANMSKKEALDAWRRLSLDDQELALDSLPGYRAFCAADPTYRPIHLVRYLSKRRFEGHAAARDPPPSQPIAPPGARSDQEIRAEWLAKMEAKRAAEQQQPARQDRGDEVQALPLGVSPLHRGHAVGRA